MRFDDIIQPSEEQADVTDINPAPIAQGVEQAKGQAGGSTQNVAQPTPYTSTPYPTQVNPYTTEEVANLRSRLADAFDPNNAQPLYSSMVDALYQPEEEEQKKERKATKLQTAVASLADAFSSVVEGYAADGHAPIEKRNPIALKVEQAMQKAKENERQLRARKMQSAMQAKMQDVSMAERAHQASQNALAKQIEMLTRAGEQENKDAMGRAAWQKEEERFKFGAAEREKDRALQEKHRQAQLRLQQIRANSVGPRSAGSTATGFVPFVYTGKDGKMKTAIVPKGTKELVQTHAMNLGKQLAPYILKQQHPDWSEHRIRRAISEMKDKDFAMYGYQSDEFEEGLAQFMGTSAANTNYMPQTANSPIKPNKNTPSIYQDELSRNAKTKAGVGNLLNPEYKRNPYALNPMMPQFMLQADIGQGDKGMPALVERQIKDLIKAGVWTNKIAAEVMYANGWDMEDDENVARVMNYVDSLRED